MSWVQNQLIHSISIMNMVIIMIMSVMGWIMIWSTKKPVFWEEGLIQFWGRLFFESRAGPNSADCDLKGGPKRPPPEKPATWATGWAGGRFSGGQWLENGPPPGGGAAPCWPRAVPRRTYEKGFGPFAWGPRMPGHRPAARPKTGYKWGTKTPALARLLGWCRPWARILKGLQPHVPHFKRYNLAQPPVPQV